MYQLPQWRALRARQLQAHPLCAECLRQGRVTPATVADHIKPHNGDAGLFLEPSNIQSLCDYRSKFNCHGTKTSHEANARRGAT
jgi:5-methylcytosine-specific restriction protein A